MFSLIFLLPFLHDHQQLSTTKKHQLEIRKICFRIIQLILQIAMSNAVKLTPK